jgi:hypothetical protein
MPQALSVVHVLISSKAAEHRLPQQTDQRTARVLSGARAGEHLARHRVRAATTDASRLAGNTPACTPRSKQGKTLCSRRAL